MKAIVCPQCGGLIDKVTQGEKLAQCSYCGARVLLEEDRPAAAQPKPEAHDTLHIPLENYKPFDEDPVFAAPDEEHSWDDYNPNAALNKAVGIAAGVVVLIFFFVIFGFVSSSKKPPPQPDAQPRRPLATEVVPLPSPSQMPTR
jgi:DNA-directed RNA polymerase subunit RPC12/RpoP